MIEIFLPVVIIFGLFIVYSDIKNRVIKNEYIATLLVIGMLYQILSGNLFVQPLSIAVIVIYGFLMSFLIWLLGFWPGGDAKLFTALLLFFPLDFYSSVNMILAYFINIFVPIFIFVMISLLLRSGSKMIKEALGYSLNAYRIFMLVTVLLGFTWFIMGFISIFGIPPNYFTTIIVLFIAFEIFSIILSAKIEFLFVSLAILRVALDFQNVFTLNFLFRFLSIIVIFIFFRFFVLHLAYHTYSRRIRISELEPGMILAEGIYIQGRAYHKMSLLQSSLIQSMRQKKQKFIHDLGELGERDVKKIKDLRKKKEIGFDDILVYHTQPFAIFLIMGYLLTYFIGSDFISFLKSIFSV